MLHAVVMAGGSGTRFWPMSRRNRPKHLLPLAGSRSLLQQAVDRIRPLVPAEHTWVITGADHAGQVRQQLHELPEDLIIAEPCRRDTAPCIGLAASLVSRLDPDATMVVMPADHLIEPIVEFCQAIDQAARLAGDDRSRLVTLGIKPDRPATGYGYIQRGSRIDSPGRQPAYHVKCFHEKPPRTQAERYMESGEFYWNSGIFVWTAATILDALRANRPQIVEALDRIVASWSDPDHETVFCREYERIAGISIDYAVLEHARNVVVLEASFRWDDVGSWGTISRLHRADGDGNSVRGKHCGIETKNSIVIAEPGHLVATIGVENLIIVQCGDATLVADRAKEEAVKQLVERMRQHGFEGFL